jgi:hypothetical protein
MGKRPTCKDCAVDGLPLTRKAPYPGPRCATHHRSRLRLNRETARGRRLVTTYGITATEYQAMLDYQGGACAICQRAKGIRKALSVDHDHAVAVLDGHEPDKGCPNCVRGLLCASCNKMLGHARDDPAMFIRAAEYIRNWPSRSV